MMDYLRGVCGNVRGKYRVIRVPLNESIRVKGRNADDLVFSEQIVNLVQRTFMPQSWRDALLATTVGEMTQREYARRVGLTEGRITQIVTNAAFRVRERANG